MRLNSILDLKMAQNQIFWKLAAL